MDEEVDRLLIKEKDGKVEYRLSFLDWVEMVEACKPVASIAPAGDVAPITERTYCAIPPYWAGQPIPGINEIREKVGEDAEIVVYYPLDKKKRDAYLKKKYDELHSVRPEGG